MKQLKEVLENYKKYETSFPDDRFGRRFCKFLTKEEMETIGFRLQEGIEHNPLEWTFKNIVLQLKDDAEFGLLKAQNERGISASLMYEVCNSWCKIIDKEDLVVPYYNYGLDTFINILNYIEDLKE